MTIAVTTPDGGVANFPDDTSPDAIRNAMRAKFGGGPAKQVAGDVAAKSGFSTMVGNIPESAKNTATGIAESGRTGAGIGLPKILQPAAGVANQLMHPTQIWDSLKARYGKGIGEALTKDPVGVITDVISLAAGVRGGIRSGVRGEAATAPTETLTPAAQKATARLANIRATDQATGGEGTLAEVERLATTSKAAPEMRQFLTKTQEGQLDRIAGDYKELTGTTRTARQALDQTLKQQREASDPAYKAAYESGDRLITTPELERITAHSDVQSAMKTAVRRWGDSQVLQGYGSAKPGVVIAGKEFNAATGLPRGAVPDIKGLEGAGKRVAETLAADTATSVPGMEGKFIKFVGGRIPAFPNVQFWDYTRRQISKMIDGEIREDGRFTARGRELIQLNNIIKTEVMSKAPEYKAALDAYSGPASYVQALKMGKEIFSSPTEEFVPDFQALSEGDKQAVRESVGSQLVAKLGSNPNARGLADLTSKIKSPEMRAKIAALMPDAASREKWLARTNREVRTSQVVAAGMKGSPTARRLALEADAQSVADDVILGGAKALMTKGGSVPGDIYRAAVNRWAKIRAAMSAERDKEMVKLLTGKQPSKTISAPKATLGQSLSLTAPSNLVEQQ